MCTSKTVKEVLKKEPEATKIYDNSKRSKDLQDTGLKIKGLWLF
jgi:hypothetical protein